MKKKKPTSHTLLSYYLDCFFKFIFVKWQLTPTLNRGLNSILTENNIFPDRLAESQRQGEDTAQRDETRQVSWTLLSFLFASCAVQAPRTRNHRGLILSFSYHFSAHVKLVNYFRYLRINLHISIQQNRLESSLSLYIFNRRKTRMKRDPV